jgi:alpha-ribazole phosphatase/probable phosphoglycerate mutase
MSMKLVVVRHATTELNAQQKLNSRIDEDLSAAGLAQLPGVVNSVKDYQLEALYASTLKRAVQTALPIAEAHGLEVILDERLMEVDCGSFNGQSYESTVPVFGVNSRDLLSTYAYDMSEYGGETYAQVEARINSFLDDLRKQSYTTVLIMTHGGIVRVFNYLLSGEKISLTQNGGVHEYEL